MQTTPPAPWATLQPAAASVYWFGASRRHVAGSPDTHYGWLPDAGGTCIVKALAFDLASHAAVLLSHERDALRRLQDAGAPVPASGPSERSDWLVTRFTGASATRRPHVQAPTTCAGSCARAGPMCLRA